MSCARIAIVGLVVALVASNAWWAYHALDHGITLTYMGVSLDDNKEALSQTLAILPVVATANASREGVLAAARLPGDKSEAFEKDGFVWIGKIGLKFDSKGQFLQARRACDPP
jgi:hypothetical protein